MSPSEREDILRWFEERKNDDYDFQEEMKTYHRSYVDILCKHILVFRDLFIESTKTMTSVGIDPFESFLTIAMACNLVYRENFLQEKTIGIILRTGYRRCDVQSAEAQEWLRYLEIKGDKIRRSGCGGERPLVLTDLMVHTMMHKAEKYYWNLGDVFGMGIQNVMVEMWKIHKSINK